MDILIPFGIAVLLVTIVGEKFFKKNAPVITKQLRKQLIIRNLKLRPLFLLSQLFLFLGIALLLVAVFSLKNSDSIALLAIIAICGIILIGFGVPLTILWYRKRYKIMEECGIPKPYKKRTWTYLIIILILVILYLWLTR